MSTIFFVNRKNFLSFLFLIIVFVTFFSIGFYTERLIFKPQSLNSPIPNFLNIDNNKQVSTLDFFLPKINSILFDKVNPPQITAKSALVYDLSTNKTLYSKDPTLRLPIASLTKIMTATIALENQNKNNQYVVTGEDLVGEDSMGLSNGEILTLSDLLYGLILHSGNDAAETLANNYPQGRAAFVKAMNDKAKSYNLTNTHFTNPSGLQGDGDQYSTAYDLLVITRQLLEESSLFNKIAATFEYEIPANSYHKEYSLENETNLISSYPGVKGVKTGYTPEAGLCLVTYLDYDGHKIIAVLLGSENRRQEMKDLLDYSLQLQGINPPKHE